MLEDSTRRRIHVLALKADRVLVGQMLQYGTMHLACLPHLQTTWTAKAGAGSSD